MEGSIVPFALNNYGSISDVIFQQDNCEPHCASSIEEYLRAKGLNVMKWPARRADLNTIENAWYMLERILRRRLRFLICNVELFNSLRED